MIGLESAPNQSLEQKPPESILSFQRSAVEKCTMMIGCNHCQSSSERMMVLALVMDRMLGQFEDLKREYHQEMALQSISSPNPSSTHRNESSTPANTSAADSRSCSYFERPPSAGRRLFLGDYEVYASEWMPILKTLLDLHAKSFGELIARWKATVTDLSAIPAMFIRIDRRFRAMPV